MLDNPVDKHIFGNEKYLVIYCQSNDAYMKDYAIVNNQRIYNQLPTGKKQNPTRKNRQCHQEKRDVFRIVCI